ncbi:hypothetical protein TTHT_1915 [Thermotomaculum hydrothermale]|uniref:Uncharacterized protein n=1 Tax=Thermotomaculum hydrothermale TaxID=981385 RepID=A0A7R6PPC9_9BACT|nr:hypothetical protein [Thermotomaculum hydrothermale]BBB33368.1 hypothetical protein TTHT_1915 [Thermotomaculum hydrothermale]
MKKITFFLILFFSISGFAKEYRYKYTFYPLPKPNLYIKNRRAVISSMGLTISVEQVDEVPFGKDFEVFKVKPNVFFIYFKIKITNFSGKKVYLDPNFIALVSNKKEYRKPLLYNDMYRALAQKYPQEKINKVLSQYILDFVNPISPGTRTVRYLVMRNFREKVKNAMLKFDPVTIGTEQTKFLIIYSVKGERFNAEQFYKKKKDF